MHTYLDCIPCFLRQTVDVISTVTDDPLLHEQAVRQALRATAELDFQATTPAAMGQRIHRMIRELSENPDPYRLIKDRSNRIAMTLLPELNRWVSDSPEPFSTALRLALAGNVIDFGVDHYTDVSEQAIRKNLREAMHANISPEAIQSLRSKSLQSRTILYLCDNAGEIVFDRLLIEQLGPEKIIAAVRGGPIINDATLEDARQTGLDKIVPVISNGSDAPGTILEQCSDPFCRAFHKADLVIAKGQGNFESLSSVQTRIFYLLKAKCPVVARHIGCTIGQYMILDGDKNNRHVEPQGNAARKEVYDA
ncbi:MAG: DUF89 family protein [Sedimentisphaerales bacterium]|nr:DUF89 family protein [Sedimentisphaerales bacterium]